MFVWQTIDFISLQTESEKTEEEQARIAERRKEQGRRLQEMAAKQRLEKVMMVDLNFNYFLTLHSSSKRKTILHI